MSGPKLEKRMILGSSKLTRNPISTSWYFCSTDWWTSEFRHFCNWNYQKLNKRSYHTFKNNYDSHNILPHLNTLLDLTVTQTTLKYGSMYIWNLLGNITIWKHNFSLETNVYNIGKIHRILKIKNMDWKQNLYIETLKVDWKQKNALVTIFWDLKHLVRRKLYDNGESIRSCYSIRSSAIVTGP